MSGYPFLTLTGTARERGYQYGSQVPELIKKNIAFYRTMFEGFGVPWETAGKISKKFEPFIRDYYPEALEEISGVAEGANLSYEDILTINCRSEILFAKPDGYTTFGILPEQSCDGHTYLGQTWDWLKPARDTTVILEVHVEGQPKILIAVEAGIIGGKGLNSEGIGVCLNALSTGKGGLGVPLHILYRAILAQTNISNALEAVTQTQRAGCGNFAIGSAQGFLMCVEYTPENFDVLMPIDKPMCHTNHYLSPLFRPQDTFKRDLTETFVRLNRLERLAYGLKRPFTQKDMWRILSDHANYPDSICSHQDPKDPVTRRFCTIYTLVMDLNERTFCITEGEPCDQKISSYVLK